MRKSLPRGKGIHHTFLTPSPRIKEEPEIPAMRRWIGKDKPKFIETAGMTQTVFSSCLSWSLLALSFSLIFGVIVGGMIIWSLQRIAWVVFDAPRTGMHLCSEPGHYHTSLLPLPEAALPGYISSSPPAANSMVDSKQQGSPRYTSGQRCAQSLQSQHLAQSLNTCPSALPFGAEQPVWHQLQLLPYVLYWMEKRQLK